MKNFDTKIDELSPWFHNIHLPDGTQTAPNHPLGDFPSFKWRQVAQYLPNNLNGWKILDIGCNAGFYMVKLAQLGADVIGIDKDSHYLRQADWVIRQFGLERKISLKKMQVYDIVNLRESFDLILFMGVFYHLRYPLLALDLVAQKTKHWMIFQTLTFGNEETCQVAEDYEVGNRKIFEHSGWPKMAFVEKQFAGDPTNWWVPNHAAVEAMLRSCGLRILARPGHEIYMCEPQASKKSTALRENKKSKLDSTTLRHANRIGYPKLRLCTETPDEL